MPLKGGDRVLVPDVLKGEEDSAMVEYYFGCDHKVTDKDEPYTVDAEECCWRLQPNLNLLLGHRNLYYLPQLHWFP